LVALKSGRASIFDKVKRYGNIWSLKIKKKTQKDKKALNDNN